LPEASVERHILKVYKKDEISLLRMEYVYSYQRRAFDNVRLFRDHD